MNSENMMRQCPIPISDYPVITPAHGGGGAIMRRLIRDLFAAAFGEQALQSDRDSAVLDAGAGRIAFTTDAFVVKPVFFPGGDIGSLAVNGTVNDLAMSGAVPKYLSCAMILEEGFPMESLWKIVCSMKRAADEAGVDIVTGDTKVVDKGKGDGIFITTSGVGEFEHDRRIDASMIRPGDRVIVNGDIARHGMAILAAREELALESPIESDCAPLNHAVAALLRAGIEIHAMRDATRGGVASALIEMCGDAAIGCLVDESAIAVREDVRGACELLGIDPLYVANEGRFVCAVPERDTERALDILRSVTRDAEPAVIGAFREDGTGRVAIKSVIGATRPLDLLSGEQLPRIC